MGCRARENGVLQIGTPLGDTSNRACVREITCGFNPLPMPSLIFFDICSLSSNRMQQDYSLVTGIWAASSVNCRSGSISVSRCSLNVSVPEPVVFVRLAACIATTIPTPPILHSASVMPIHAPHLFFYPSDISMLVYIASTCMFNLDMFMSV